MLTGATHLGILLYSLTRDFVFPPKEQKLFLNKSFFPNDTELYALCLLAGFDRCSKQQSVGQALCALTLLTTEPQTNPIQEKEKLSSCQQQNKPMHTCSKEKAICTLCPKPTQANESHKKERKKDLPCCKAAAVCTWLHASQLISNHLCFVRAFSRDVQPMVQTASSCQHCFACSPVQLWGRCSAALQAQKCGSSTA